MATNGRFGNDNICIGNTSRRAPRRKCFVLFPRVTQEVFRCFIHTRQGGRYHAWETTSNFEPNATQSLPLDLSDEETLMEGDMLALNIGKLDVAGWNTDGMIRSSSWIRVRELVSFIREEILQLSLGNINFDQKDRTL